MNIIYHIGVKLSSTTEDPAITHTVKNLTSIPPTMTATPYNITLPGQTSSTAIITHSVVCEPLTVPVSSNHFCSDKPDGYYLESGNPASMFQCSDGITHIAWCPDNTVQNKAGQMNPSRKLTIIMVGISSLLISAWANT